MKKDLELERIRSIMRRLDELEQFMYGGTFSEREIKRINQYIASRYSYFFDWIQETP